MFDLRFAMYDVACTARQLSASKGQPCKRTSKIENRLSDIKNLMRQGKDEGGYQAWVKNNRMC